MKEAQHYINCGKEDVGYKSPELSSSDTYPAYIEEEVRRCVREIQSNQTTDTVTFAFITDIHYSMSYNHMIRLRRTVNAYKEIAKRVHIDKLILGGDYTNEGCKEYKSDCFRELRAELSDLEFFPINGNHDDGSIWDHKYIQCDNAVNHLTTEDLYKLFYNHVPSLGGQFDKKGRGLYYYLDNKEDKIRYICLDACNIPYIHKENGALKYRGQDIFTFSQNQFDWLINDALRFSEEGWSIILFTHSIALPSAKREDLAELLKRTPILSDLIECYKKGGSCELELDDEELSVKVKADFSNSIRGDVICFYVGDYHRDLVEKSHSGLPYILTGNAVTYCTPATVQRYDGDKTELLFDVVTIDKKSRTLHITRVGAGESRTVTY